MLTTIGPKEITMPRPTFPLLVLVAVVLLLPGGSLVQAAPADRPITCSGPIVPHAQVAVRTGTGGQLVDRAADVGDAVKQGQVLARLDATEARNAVEQLRIALNRSQIGLDRAKCEAEMTARALDLARKRLEAAMRMGEAKLRDAAAKAARVKQLWEKAVATQEDAEAAQAAVAQAEGELAMMRLQQDELKNQDLAVEAKRLDVKRAQTEVEMDKHALDAASERLARIQITAPIDGVVTACEAQAGQSVPAGAAIFTIADSSRLYVLVNVAEADIALLQPGEAATFTTPACAGRTFGGSVARIAPASIQLDTRVAFEVRIAVNDNDRAALRLGMTANVRITPKRPAGER
jgi:multidrug resistance efflux pump